MKIKIKDADGPLTEREREVQYEALQVMTWRQRAHYQYNRVVYWDPTTKTMLGCAG
jgi:hypothetical protein